MKSNVEAYKEMIKNLTEEAKIKYVGLKKNFQESSRSSYEGRGSKNVYELGLNPNNVIRLVRKI